MASAVIWLFVAVIVFFHLSEVALVVVFNRPELSWSCANFLTQRNSAPTWLLQCLPLAWNLSFKIRFIVMVCHECSFPDHTALQPCSVNWSHGTPRTWLDSWRSCLLVANFWFGVIYGSGRRDCEEGGYGAICALVQLRWALNFHNQAATQTSIDRRSEMGSAF